MVPGQAHGLHLRGEGDEEWQSLPLHLGKVSRPMGTVGLCVLSSPQVHGMCFDCLCLKFVVFLASSMRQLRWFVVF